MRFSSTLSRLWKLLCLSWFGYYVVNETLDYLERAMVTNAEFEFEPDVSAIAICLYMPMIISVTDISSPIFANHTKGELKAKLEHVLYEEYSSDFILNHTERVGEFLTPVHGVYNQDEFLKRGHRCAEYSNQKGSKSVVVNVVSDKIYSPQTHVSFHAYQRNRKPRRARMVHFWMQKPYDVYMTLEKVIIKRLQAPFATECRDYSKDYIVFSANADYNEKLEDRDHCFEKCIFNQNNNTTPREFVATRSKINSGKYSHISYCGNICRQPDCYEESFQLLSKSISRHKSSLPVFKIHVISPVMSLQYVASCSWIQYVVNVAGLVNTLLGISAIDFFNTLNPLASFKRIKTCLLILPYKQKMWKILTKLIIFLSTTGFLWQSIYATIDFLRYDTSSELYIGKTIHPEVPVYTICFPIMSLLKPKYRNMSFKNLEKHSFRNITAMTYRVEDIFGQLDTPHIKTSIVVKEGSFTTHYVNRLKCFQIDLKYKLPLILFDRLIRAYTNDTFKHLRYDVYLGVDKTVPFDYDSERNLYDLMFRHVLYYTYIRIHLLPYPFKSNCNSDPAYTRERCLDTCLRKNSSMSGLSVEFTSQLTLQEYSYQYIARQESCREMCSALKCKTVFIHVILFYSLFSHSIELDISYRETIFTLLSSLPLVVYIMYLTSFLSFWLGLSLIALFRVIPHLRRYLDSSLHVSDVTNIRSIVKRNLVFINMSRMLIMLLLLTGLLYHLHNIIDLYLLYEMQTSTMVTIGGAFYPPPISLCYYLSTIHKRSGPAPQTCKTTVCLDNTTLSFNEVFDTLQIRHSQDDDLRLLRAVEYLSYAEDRYFLENMKCFRIKPKTHEITLHSLKIRRVRDSMKRTVFSLNYTNGFASLMPTLILYLHDKLDVGRTERYHALSSNKVRYHYKETITQLLKHPYSTNCYDYTVDGLGSREQCIDQCSQKEFLNQFSFISQKIAHKITKHGAIPYNNMPLLSHDYIKVTKICQKRCPLNECHSKLYETVELERQNVDYLWNFSLAPPISITQSIYEAKFKFFAFAIYIFGIFGLWLGLDALTFPSVMNSLFRRRNR